MYCQTHLGCEKTNDKYLNKKVLSNATSTLCISSILKTIGIPNMISIPIINVLVEFCNTDIKSEEKIMLNSCVGFKGYRMSEVKKVLQKRFCVLFSLFYLPYRKNG